MRPIFLCALAILSSSIACAAEGATTPEGKEISVIDYYVDYKSYKGRAITVTECEFGGANSSFVFCRAADNSGVSVSVQGKTLNKEDFRRALKECAGYSRNGDRCTGAVVGIAADFMGPSIQSGRIVWDKP